jgi:hypothetical protein
MSGTDVAKDAKDGLEPLREVEEMFMRSPLRSCGEEKVEEEKV